MWPFFSATGLNLSRAHKWAELLRNPYVLEVPVKETKTELATSPLASRGPTSGLKCYVTPIFSGVLGKGDKIRLGYLTPTFSGAPMGRNCCLTGCSRGSPRKGTKSKLASSHLPSRGPTNRRNGNVTLVISGVPSKWDQTGIGYLTPIF